MIYKIVGFLVKFGTEILCRIDAPDIDKVPQKGPLIVVSNHTGQMEVAVFFGLLVAAPDHGLGKDGSLGQCLSQLVVHPLGA